jgi:hypothetical protein
MVGWLVLALGTRSGRSLRGDYRPAEKGLPMRRLLMLTALLVALPAGAADTVYVAGNPAATASNCRDNAPDCGCAVDYAISDYGVANAQYVSGWLEGIRAS